MPAVADFDLLVIMGGPMSVNDESKHPWLVDEKRLVVAAMCAQRPILGICLGAQLIASALGARVYPGHKEIGWFEVQRIVDLMTPNALGSFPDRFTPLHWHGETFDLPSGARLLASSQGCRHQAFQMEDRVVGLQFHLEASPDSVEALIEHAGDEIVAGPSQQTPAQLRTALGERCDATRPLLDGVLCHLTGV